MEFDFLAETTDQPVIPEVLHGPNMTQVEKMTRKEFTQGVLNVYQALGGDVWLLQQAAIDPKSFIEMLKKMIPTNMNLDQMDGFEITLIDRYGNRAELKPNTPRESGSDPKPLRTASPGGPEVSVTETFGPPSPRLLPSNTPDDKEFDFEL